MIKAATKIDTLLIIGYVWPEPNSSAAGSRMMQLITSFQQQHYRVVFATPAEPSPHSEQLTTHGVESVSISLNCSSFNQQLEQIQPDVVLFDRFMMEEQFGWRVNQTCPKAVRILDMEDLHSLRHARHQAVKSGLVAQKAELNHQLAHRELAAVFRSDLSLVISPYEYQLMQQYYQVPTSQMLLVPFMLSSTETSQLSAFENRQHFISVGNFRHAPNWDAVLQLRQLWPSIRSQCPQAELHIYGAYPPKKATQLDNINIGFRIKGWAPSVSEIMSQTRVLLAPLRFGAGLKGKLLDAMVHQLPSVTTPIGAEGMTTKAAWPGVIAHSEQEFIESAVALYQDSKLWTQSLETIPEHLNLYSFAAHSELLHQHIQRIRQDIAEFRQQHFIGSMLQHHSLKSTQYMSQWIEEKNKKNL